MADEVSVELQVEGNPESATRAADQMAAAFERTMAKAAPALGRLFAREFAKATLAGGQLVDVAQKQAENFNLAAKAAQNMGGATVAASKTATAAASGLGLSASRAAERYAQLTAAAQLSVVTGKNAAGATSQVAAANSRLAASASAAAAAVGNVKQQAAGATAANKAAAQSSTSLSAALTALTQRSAALRQTLAAQGSDPKLFALLNQQLKEVLDLQNRLKSAGSFANNPLGLEKLAQEATSLSRTIAAELRIITRAVDQTNAVQAQSARINLSAKQSANDLLKVEARKAHGLEVSTIQANSAESVAALKASSNQQIQQAQASSRARIEIARFTFRQIAFFEQQIAKVLAGSARLLGNLASSAATGLGRVANIFRRGDSGLNDNFQGALLQRERALDGSLDRQTRRIQQAATQQGALYTRIDRQVSTGLAGLASGRSQIGTLLGGGAALGGGFLLGNKLKEGFNETVRLNEALNAVRQTFGSASDEIIKFSESSVEVLFQTQSAALKAATDFGIFAKSAGLVGDELVGFTTELSVLATDLASFKDTNPEEAVTAISAALRGESEPIRRYGVLLNETVLQQRAFTIGIADSIRQLTPQERVLAAHAEILAQTTVQQGDAARTADDFANSLRRTRAQSIKTFAAITGGLVPFGEYILNVVFPTLKGLQDLITNDLSPALQTFRSALIGASIALGGLLAARVAGEALQFLAIGLRATLTPLGLLVVAVAGLGAVLAVLRETNPAVRAVLDNLRSFAASGLAEAIDRIALGMTLFAGLIERNVIPALAQFAGLAARTLAPALRIVAGLIVGVIVPAIGLFASFITSTLVPGFLAAASVIANNIVPALRTFGRIAIAVLGFILPILEPTILGFLRLGDAIAETFRTGDFSNLLSGLGGLAVGVGRSFALVGEAIYDALRAPIVRAVAFIFDYFDSVDWTNVGISILRAVETIGLVLGTVITHPYFIRAVAAIVAAAVAIGGAFIKGFAEGVISNLPQLARDLGNLIQFGLEQAVDNLGYAGIAAALFAGLSAVLLGQSLLALFRRTGQQGGGSFAKGLARGIATAPASIVGSINGLFGGTGGISDAIARNGRLAAEAYSKSFARRMRDFNRLGVTPTAAIISPATAAAQEGNIRRLTAEFDTLRGSIGKAQTDARLFQQRGSEAFRGLGAAAVASAKLITPGFQGSFTQVQAGLSRTVTAITDQFASLQARGRLSGQALGGAVLAGFGAVMAGQSLGQGNTVGGIAGILASALGAGVATSSPAVGAAVLGLGLVTAAFTRSGEAARKAKERIEEYAEALLNAGTFADQQKVVLDALRTSILGADDGIQEVFRGFDADAFAEKALSGTLTFEGAFADLAKNVSADTATIQAFLDKVDLTNIEDARMAFLQTDEGVAAARALAAAGVEGNAFLGALGLITQQTSDVGKALEDVGLIGSISWKQVALGVGDAAEAERVYADRLASAAESFRTNFGGMTTAAAATAEQTAGLEQTLSGLLGVLSTDQLKAYAEDLAVIGNFQLDFEWLEDLIKGANDAAASVDRVRVAVESVRRIRFEKIVEDWRDAQKAALEYESALADVNGRLKTLNESSNLVETALSDLNKQRTDAIRNQIEGVSDRLDAAREAADLARDSLTKFLTGRYVDTASAQVDALIGNLDGIGDNIEEALRRGGIQGDAALRQAVGGFESQLAGIVQAGFDEGLRSVDDFRGLLAPLGLGISEQVGESGQRIVSLDFTEGIGPEAAGQIQAALDRVFEGNSLTSAVQAIMDAESNELSLQRQLDGLNLASEAEVIFNSEQVKQALLAAGLKPEFLIDITPEAIAAAQLLSDAAKIVNDYNVARGLIAAEGGLLGDTPTGSGVVNNFLPGSVPISVNGAGDPVVAATETVTQLGTVAGGGPFRPLGFRR